MCRRISLTAILIAMAMQPYVAVAVFEPPANDAYITVAEGVPSTVLSPEEEEALEQSLREYDKQTSNQIAVLIVSTLAGEPIEDAAVETGRRWGVGTAEHENGIVLLIAYEDREMFLATGYGLEGAIPDIVAKGIIDRDLTPHFRDGKYAEGITAAIESLQKHIGGEYTTERYASSSDTPPFAWLLFLAFLALDTLGAFLARSKSWWLGGVLGGVFGFILVALFRWWLSIPLLVMFGLLLDYIVSRTGYRGGRWRGGGWGGPGRGSGGGGFGGFGGGSFGGGGARGKW